MIVKPLSLSALIALTSMSACTMPGIGAGVAARTPPQVMAVASPKDRLVAAIEADDCLLTAANVGTILLRANLTQAALTAIVPELAAEGRAEVAADGAIRVLTDNCI